MTLRVTFALAALLSAGALLPSQAHAATLNDCFLMALKQSETLAQSGESIVQADEQYRQALGAVLPKVSLDYSYLRQDDHAYTPAIEASNPSSQQTWAVTLAQPLFHGFS
jgi:outer membrane protein TolC